MLSDDRFRFVAGLEYECDRRMHVLGFGVTRLSESTNPEQVIKHIGSQNGVSVIAHPMDSMFEWIEGFEVLPDGIEVWNSKYDGRYAPRPATFELLNRLQARRPRMLAFYGQDMHWKKQYRGLFNVVRATSNAGESLLSAVREGSYHAEKAKLRLPSDGKVADIMLARFGRANARSTRRRGWMKRIKRTLDRVGVSVPASLKAQLRRMF